RVHLLFRMAVREAADCGVARVSRVARYSRTRLAFSAGGNAFTKSQKVRSIKSFVRTPCAPYPDLSNCKPAMRTSFAALDRIGKYDKRQSSRRTCAGFFTRAGRARLLDDACGSWRRCRQDRAAVG